MVSKSAELISLLKENVSHLEDDQDYKAGFDDVKQDKKYGTSRTSNSEKSKALYMAGYNVANGKRPDFGMEGDRRTYVWVAQGKTSFDTFDLTGWMLARYKDKFYYVNHDSELVFGGFADIETLNKYKVHAYRDTPQVSKQAHNLYKLLYPKGKPQYAPDAKNNPAYVDQR